MRTKGLLLLLGVLPLLNAQNAQPLFFPEDDGGYISNDNVVKIPPNINLTEIRGTTQYEKYIDQIISGGVSKLTLAINRIFIQKMGGDRENIVFAPVSIAGALALVLLGSNGKTFEEITAIMGLATGVDVQTRPMQVHEQFGRMINKLESTAGFDMKHQVNFAAAIFVQNSYPVRSLYKKAAQDLYQSEIINVDFEQNPLNAQEVVNDWISQRTKGKVRDILGETPLPTTKIIIVSAMYFKASWEKPFFEGATNRRPFYINGRTAPTDIEVEMMANGGRFPYFKDPNLRCEVMGFPYKGNATSMYVVMPFDSNAQKLRELEERLTPSDLEHLASNTVYTRAVTIFPKMKLRSTIELKTILQLLGIKSLFNPSEANLALLSPGEGQERNVQSPTRKLADDQSNPLSDTEDEEDVLIFSRMGEKNFSCSNTSDPLVNSSACFGSTNTRPHEKSPMQVTNRIMSAPTADTIYNLRQLINQQSTDNSFQNPGLYADRVLHKVYMDITETGTEAAAATSISISRDGGSVTFRVDVPFFFFIRHEETRTILFWGSVTTPSPNFKKT